MCELNVWKNVEFVLFSIGVLDILFVIVEVTFWVLEQVVNEQKRRHQTVILGSE